MKNNYILVLLFTFAISQITYAQNCTYLGCAANYGVQVIDATVPDASGVPGTCYDNISYKQVYWQFFFSDNGGDFTQTYTPIINPERDPLDLDYLVFDMGTSIPSSITCPVDPSSFNEIYCNINNTMNLPTGPGYDGVVTTQPNHYYAIAVYSYQFKDKSYMFSIGKPQLDGVDLTSVNCPGALPVKLSSFEASLTKCSVNLKWQSQSESSFRQYEIEYSSDGTTFQKIATVLSTSGIGVKSYSYNHPAAQAGNLYYRLKMINMDGGSTYSKTISLKMDCGLSKVIVYPNPVTDMLSVSISNETCLAKLFDNDGKLVYSTTMQKGINTINMATLGRGVYILRIQNNTEFENIKIIK
ncbi:MAG: T9SS type A sorting domain-containing protein [Ferruginibacter sp.]